MTQSTRLLLVGTALFGALLVCSQASAEKIPLGTGDTGEVVDFPICDYQDAYIPTMSVFDWRWYGLALEAKNQGVCSSSYAFAAAAVMEAHLRLGGEAPVDLSEQQLISCWEESEGCCPGNMGVLTYYSTHPARSAVCDEYPDATTMCGSDPLDCQDLGPCNDLFTIPAATTVYRLQDIKKINQIKAAVFHRGPAYFRFDVYPAFYRYWNDKSGSVYQYDPELKENQIGGHAVLIIGWDDTAGAWLCLNSWGKNAGPNGDGTFWISYANAGDLNFDLAHYRNDSLRASEVSRCLDWSQLLQDDDSYGGPVQHPITNEYCLGIRPQDVPDMAWSEDSRVNLAFGVAGTAFLNKPSMVITMSIIGDDPIPDEPGRKKIEDDLMVSTQSETDDCKEDDECSAFIRPSKLVPIAHEETWMKFSEVILSDPPGHSVLRFSLDYQNTGREVYIKQVCFVEQP